jgi:hypothetical protein
LSPGGEDFKGQNSEGEGVSQKQKSKGIATRKESVVALFFFLT